MRILMAIAGGAFHTQAHVRRLFMRRAGPQNIPPHDLSVLTQDLDVQRSAPSRFPSTLSPELSMENTSSPPPKSVLIELGNATRDITQLIALTRVTEQGLENLQQRTGSIRHFTFSALVPDRTRSGVGSFKLENPDPKAIFETLKAAGRHVIFLRETGEIAPAFPETGLPTQGQPYLTGVRDWSYDENTPPEERGFNSAATVVLADGRKTDVYFAAKRPAFTPQSSTVLQDQPAPGKGSGG
jgi:hypothetical protein